MTKTKKTTVMDDAKQFGDDVMQFGKNTYLFGLGTVATMEDQMRDVVDRMVDKGEAVDKEGKTLVGKMTGKAKEFGKAMEDGVEDTVSTTLNRAGVPSRKEIRTLIARVEELTEKVDTLAVH